MPLTGEQKEKQRDYQKSWRAANPDKVKAYQNTEANRASKRNWHKLYPEKSRALKKRHYYLHREEECARSRAWAVNNPEKAQAKNAAYYAANAERIRNESKAWKKANLDRARAQNGKRRALKIAAEGSYTAAEFALIVKRQNGKCAECSRKRKLEADHIVPLTRGGCNFAYNIQGLCRPCNCSKRNSIRDYAVYSLFDKVAV